MRRTSFRRARSAPARLTVGLALLGVAAGCANQKPDYSRQLLPGESALRQIRDPARMPDLAAAGASADSDLMSAIGRSAVWFQAPSSQRYFPMDDVSHRRAAASVVAMRELLDRHLAPMEFEAEVKRLFDVYESVGYNGDGIVLFTGYYAGVFPASRTPTGRFRYPLYRRPADLVTDEATGEPRGRRLSDGRIVPYPTRREIDQGKLLAGQELVWLEDALSVYVVHVNGSAKLQIVGPGGGEIYVGYAGKTDRPYTGLGQSMIEEGLIGKDEASLAAIRRVYQKQPDRVLELINRNDSFVFFQEYDGSKWPSGSLGVKVTEKRTLATDKKIYPRGGVVLVDTQAVAFGGRKRPFLQFMVDQDAGGAIQAPGRADIFMGIGDDAEVLAGGQYAEGRLYYLFLKPTTMDQYASQ